MESFFNDFHDLAVIGLSRESGGFSRKAYEFLKSEGYRLYPVNPHTDNIDGDKCYLSLKEIPRVEAAIFFTKPEITKQMLPICQQKGIQNLWFQFGSFNSEVISAAEKLGLKPVSSCVFLHHPNSKFPHNIHRFINGFFSKDK